MKFNELSIGDRFTIVRENNTTVYIKQEYCILDPNGHKQYRKPKGDTRVEKVL